MSTRDVMYNMINIIITAIYYIWKLRVNPNSSHHKEKNSFLFLLLCIYIRWWIFPKLIVIIASLMYVIIMLYTLNLYSAVCQLYLNKTGRKKETNIMEWNQNFCTAKETINKMKRQPTDWEKIFANDVTDKGFVSRIYKQLMWLNIIKTNNPTKI